MSEIRVNNITDTGGSTLLGRRNAIINGNFDVWHDVVAYEGLYQVSDQGEVKALERVRGQGHIHPEKIISGWTTQQGYQKVSLTDLEGKTSDHFIHRLVARAFISNPENKRCVNHIDGDKQNNLLDNLEWSTHSENEIHAYQIGLKSSSEKQKTATSKANKERRMLTMGQIEQIFELRKQGLPYPNIGNAIGISRSMVGFVLNGKRYADMTEELRAA